MKQTIRDFAVMAVIAIIVFVALQMTVQSAVVFGPSMEPNFHENQRLLVNRVVYRTHPPERGDVIIFQRPRRPDEDNYIKRVIGLPGEYVKMTDGEVFIHQPDGNVIKLVEPYISEPAAGNYVSDLIRQDEYFVLGDNRNHTNDSRNGWMAERGSIIGKAWISIWPPNLWGKAANYPAADIAIAATE